MPPVDAGQTPPLDPTQTPPVGEAETAAWLEAGSFRNWTCEPAVHAARSPSPHGFNRICSNDVISRNVSANGEWPVGAAAVKQVYDRLSDTTPSGYAVYLKTEPESQGGKNWYWYEKLKGRSTISGIGASVCIGCHIDAGSSIMPLPGARDLVFSPVSKE